MAHYFNPAIQEQAIVSIHAKLIKHIFRIGRRMLLNDGDPTWLSLPSPISWTSVLPCGIFKPFVRGLQGTVEGASDLLSSRDSVLRRHRHWLSIPWPHPTHSYRQSHHMQWWGKAARQRPKRATNDSENPGKQFRPNDGIKPCVFQPKDVKSTERSTLLFTLIIFFIAMTKHLSRTNSRKEGFLLAHNLKA